MSAYLSIEPGFLIDYVFEYRVMAKKSDTVSAGNSRISRKVSASCVGVRSGGTAAQMRQAAKGIIATALSMSASGLSPGRSGNVSARWGDGMLITPSGMAYDAIRPADIVYVDADGSVAAGSRKPSSEWRFHLSAYHERPDMGAIVHTHSLHAVVLACAHKPIPAFHYMVAIAGGDHVPLVPYAPFGTKALADFVAGGVCEVNACLMANHGQIALGATLGQALELAHEVEILSEQYLKVLALGKAKLLSKREMRDFLERFAGYGQHAQDATGNASKSRAPAKSMTKRARAKAARKPRSKALAKTRKASSASIAKKRTTAKRSKRTRGGETPKG